MTLYFILVIGREDEGNGETTSVEQQYCKSSLVLLQDLQWGCIYTESMFLL